MTYDEAYAKIAMLSEARRLRLRGKALTDILVGRAVLTKVMDDFETQRRAVYDDKEASDEEKDRAFEALACKDCGIEDVTLSRESFEQIADAVYDDKAVELHDPLGKAVESPQWLSMFFGMLVKV